MSLVAYSTGYIKFKPTDKHHNKTKYSDRSVIELRLTDQAQYFLRAIDVENNRKEIFNIFLGKHGIYICASSEKDPDEIRCQDGIYYVRLNETSRNDFQKEIKILNNSVVSNKKSFDTDSAKTIFVDIHKLGECIENGNSDEAANITKKLVSQGIQLERKMLNKNFNDEQFQIRIKIDGIDFLDDDISKPYVLNVYKSTTIHELQVLFEYLYKYPLTSQCFFVNGHLAHTESTMNDLNVQNNSLFVLFLTKKYIGQNS